MLLVTEESRRSGQTRQVSQVSAVRSPLHQFELMRFTAIVLQLGLLALLIKRYNLESPAFFQLTLLAFLGFAVHYFLPMRFRLPFFAGLSLLAIVMVLGVVPSAWLIGIGLVLIGLCHAPLPFWVRAAILAAAGCILGAMRGGWLPSVMPLAVWPILGSMYMFRLIVYLYDLHHRRPAKSLSQSLSYFFMLPNICFPLFPIVDFQAFQSKYFNEDRFAIYQKGAHWILRGVVHLLIYRLLYKNWGISLYDVANAGDLVHYCVWSFLLYLRVSGQFHIIVGMLHLFGFNLAETHHFYYLASSFTDFWRRINIYWKDFMMKVFFYPCYFRLRLRGPMESLVLSTLAVFFVTWILHSVQWFWLRGSFLFSGHDILFWSILAAMVVANSLWEMKFGASGWVANRGRDPSSSDCKRSRHLRLFAYCGRCGRANRWPFGWIYGDLPACRPVRMDGSSSARWLLELRAGESCWPAAAFR